MPQHVVVETELGAFTVALDERAPLSTANFLAYVDAGFLDRMSAYRIVTLANQPPETVHKIEVVQWGVLPENEAYSALLPPIAHEPTSESGLQHKDMTISMARFAPGSAGAGFFICIGDQPELDHGGRRNPDGLGFAAFGQVIAGRETIAAMFARAEPQEMVERPIAILGAHRVDPA